MAKTMKEHWDAAYSSREPDKLGWYEKTPSCSVRLLSRLDIDKGDAVIDIGAGASTFVDYLAEEGYRNVIACDISGIALEKLKNRLGEEKASRIKWLVDDVTQPRELKSLSGVALWHDRALLHFLLGQQQREMYLSTLKSVIKKGGYVIIAVFSIEGAKKCCGLDLKNYDHNALVDFLGEEFSLIEHFDYTHRMPSGDPRPYVYTLFKRV